MLGVLGAAPAEAACTFGFFERPGHVSGNGHGSIDTAALTPAGNGAFSQRAVNASLGLIGVPRDDVSRTGLAGGIPFEGEFFASPGQIVGTHVSAWGIGKRPTA